MHASKRKSEDLSFDRLKELDSLFDRQLKKMGGNQRKERALESGTGWLSQATYRLKLIKLLGIAVALLLLSILPFWVLIRSSLFLYQGYGFNGWIALAAGVGMTIFLLLLYAIFISYRFRQTAGVHKYVRWGMVFLVVAYSCYGLLYFSGVNAKSEEVESYYRSLHPILRVTLATTLLVDEDLVVTDMQRQPEDYVAMGLPVQQESLHYLQPTGYVHAVDIRTRNRPEWKNWLTRGLFHLLGMNTLRHVGTSDHLHISLPINTDT